jgi:outer membrane protein TolC
LGTDDRNRPLEAQALSELDVAQTYELRLRERLDSDLTNAREAQQSAQGQLEAETARARLLRERARLIEQSFRAGESPLPDLLRALATAAQADSAVARQTAARGLARARLQQALGLLP